MIILRKMPVFQSSTDSSFLDDSLPVSDSSDRMTNSRADDEVGASTRRRPVVNQEEFRRCWFFPNVFLQEPLNICF